MWARSPVATQFDRHHDIFQCGQRRNELKRLKHKSDIGVPEGGKGVFTQEMQAVPMQDHRARRRTIQAGAETQQGGFAAA